MEDLFDTYDEAKAHLEIKRAKLYKDIADRGDIIIEDRSFAGNCFSYTHPEKFRAFMLITTKSMLEDFKNYVSVDAEAELTKILATELNGPINTRIIRDTFNLTKEQYAVYEKTPAHGSQVNGVILGNFSTPEEAQIAREKYGYTSDNYYVDVAY